MRVLDAAGFDVVLVETVGVGQSEVEVAGLADTTVVLLAPGMGDGIQAAKAGILEVGDVYVVNKADRDGAAQVAPRPARDAVAGRAPRGRLAPADPQDRRPVGGGRRGGRGRARRAPGVAGVVGGAGPSPAPRRARAEIEAIAVAALRRRWGDRAASAPTSTTWPPRWSRAGPTRTPPPTGCSRASAAEARRTGAPARRDLCLLVPMWCKVPMVCRCRLPTFPSRSPDGALR